MADNKRKHYLDNIRWVITIVVILYHVIYMYNAEGIVGVVGKITNQNVQYQDAFQYAVYPWLMPIFFIVSGISAKLYREALIYHKISYQFPHFGVVLNDKDICHLILLYSQLPRSMNSGSSATPSFPVSIA